MIPRRLRDFGKLTPAEAKLRDGCGTGLIVVLGDGEVPEPDGGPDRQVRASFLRYLILGGCEACRPSEKGVQLQGALVVDDWEGSELTRGLDLEGCRVDADIWLVCCRFHAPVLLRGASVRTVSLNGSVLKAGLVGDGLQAAGAVILRSAETAGEVRFLGAKLDGDLDCVGTKLRNESGGALSTDGLQASGNVFLRNAEVAGEVRLLGARLGGDLDCLGAKLRNAGKRTLSADRVQAAGNVILRNAEVAGEVRLPGAKLSGNVDCLGARLWNEGKGALTADGLQTSGNVFLRSAEVAGEIRLAGANLGAGLDCAGAKLRNADGPVLSADGLEAAGNVFLRSAEVLGELRLLSAKLGGNLYCEGAKLRNAGARALSLDGARIDGAIFLRQGAEIDGILGLTEAQLGSICDDPTCWPKQGNLLLNRCIYGAFVGKGISAAERVDWLSRQEPARFGQEFWPQPWEQCAKVLREMGHRADARAVLIEKEHRQRAVQRARVKPVRRLLHWVWDELFLGLLTGYGHQPMRAMVGLLAAFLLGWWIFWGAWTAGQIKPNAGWVLRSDEWVLCGYPAGAPVALAGGTQPQGLRRPLERRTDCFARQPQGASYPRFNAAIYSLDTLLPVVDLEVQDNWLPDESGSVGRIARWYLWLHIGLGWALSLLAVAGFTGLIRNDP